MSTQHPANTPADDPTPSGAVSAKGQGRDRQSVIAREKEQYGGVKIGSAFFGWLTATGTAVLLTALAAAAGTAVVFVVVSGGSLWYALASCYALVGAAVSSGTGGFAALGIALAVGVALVVASTAVVRLARRGGDAGDAPIV